MVLNNMLEAQAEKLYINQNLAKEEEQRNIISKEAYKEILRPVTDVVGSNKDASIGELRDLLYKNSGPYETLRKAVYDRKMAPGAVISYGGNNYQEIITLGMTSDFEDAINANERTIYDLASVTKLFTSVSILQLVRAKKIDWNKPVSFYLPEFNGLKSVSVYHLLTFSIPVKTNGRIDRAGTKEEAEKILRSVEYNSEDNGKRPYTDMGAIVLKYVIEKVSGQRFYDYVVENILSPLKMENTFVQIPVKKLGNVAQTGYDGFYYKDGNYRVNKDVTIGSVYDAKARILGQKEGDLSGHAGLFSTSEDMTRLALSLINCGVLPREMIEMMGDNKTGNLEKSVQYLGMLCYSKNPVQDNSEIYHPLSGKTFASAGWTGTKFTVDPVNKIYYSLLSNRSNNRMTYIDDSKKDLVMTNEKGMKSITLPNGKTMVDATRYAWDRDRALVHPVIKLAIQYGFLDEIYEREKENIVQPRKIRRI